jgi:hypothetical protein
MNPGSLNSFKSLVSIRLHTYIRIQTYVCTYTYITGSIKAFGLRESARSANRAKKHARGIVLLRNPEIDHVANRPLRSMHRLWAIGSWESANIEERVLSLFLCQHLSSIPRIRTSFPFTVAAVSAFGVDSRRLSRVQGRVVDRSTSAKNVGTMRLCSASRPWSPYCQT